MVNDQKAIGYWNIENLIPYELILMWKLEF